MRLSSPLLLILAAITMANAASVDSVVQPKHKLVRVKNGAAHVNALNTAKVNADTKKVDLKNLDLKHVASVSVRRGIDVGALGAAHANVDLKQVAGIVHTLSASLEHHDAAAGKILKLKDHKLAAKKAHKLLGGIKHDLAHAVVDIHGLTKSATGKKAAVSAHVARRGVDLQAVASSVKGVSGSSGLVGLLEGLKVDAVLQSDVISVLADVQVLKVLHDVADIDTVLNAVVAVPEAVSLLNNIQQLDDPLGFVEALADIPSIAGLVAAVPGGLNEIVKLEGAAKLVTYIDTYGFNTVARVLNTAGVEKVLQAVVAVPDSVQLLESLKSVVDVDALVSGLHVLSVVPFVESIKAVTDVTSLVDVLISAVGSSVSKRSELLSGVEDTISGVTSAVDLDDVLGLVKRDLLQTVEGTVSDVNLDEVLGLVKRADLLTNVKDTVSDTVSGVSSTVGVQKVLSLKRALAHISALPDSDLVSIDQAVKRALLEDVNIDSILDNVNVGLLKRSILDLSSVVNTKEVDGIVDSILKRNAVADVLGTAGLGSNADSALGGVQGTVGLAAGTAVETLDAVGTVKRDVVAQVENLDLVDLNRVLSLKRSDILSSVGNTVSDLDFASILPAIKRNLLAADANIPHTVDYTALHARNTAGALLTDSVSRLVSIAGTLLDKVVHITDLVRIDAVTEDVKSVVVPLVAAVGTVLDNDVVRVEAPGVYHDVQKILKLAQKTAKSLP